MMKFLRSVSYIINHKTLILTLIAIIATYLCIKYEWTADFPLTLVGIAIVFPIVFSINSAYRRRERALRSLAEAKGNALGLYHTSRNQLESVKMDLVEKLKEQIIDLFIAIRDFLVSPVKQPNEKEEFVYEKISMISSQLKVLKDAGLAGRFVARMNQYLTRVMVSFDNLKIVFYYRTPRTLRAYSKVFIYIFPIIYAPYFAYTSFKYSPGLGYLMPILYSFILVSLDNIQEHLENPYDQIGEDDITLDIDEIRKMLR